MYWDWIETLKSQQYVLQVTEENITDQGGDGAGVLYGVQTLCQMMHEYGALLPAVRIEDEPDPAGARLLSR